MIKKIDILMLDEKNALKLPEDQIDFNLNQKMILSPLLDAQISIYTQKKTVPAAFDFLVSFVPSDISVRHEIQRDKRIEIMN